MGEDEKIQNIAKFKKMREEMKGFKQLGKLVPFAKPFLRVAGIDTDQLSEIFAEIPELENQFREISELPDKFNDIFAERGFIMFEALTFEVAKEAVNLAAENVEKGELFLVEHFSPEIVGIYLEMMHGIEEFRPRMELARKALIDYTEGRYHACVPVVLALMDGLVNELNPQRLGISADKADLTAWDSMTAHEKGLNALKDVLFKTRKTTRTEEITLPFRHGILHGMDLGYDNKVVAAKTWAALFAIRDWAAKAQKNEFVEPPPTPKPTVKELLAQMMENRSISQQLEEWEPRLLTIDRDVPSSADSADYLEGTPERCLVEFLHLWKAKNYGHMVDYVLSFLKRLDMPKRIREIYSKHSLKEFKIVKIIDVAAAVTEIDVHVSCDYHGESIEGKVKFRLVVNESPDGRVMMRGIPGASWGIANVGTGTLPS